MSLLTRLPTSIVLPLLSCDLHKVPVECIKAAAELSPQVLQITAKFLPKLSYLAAVIKQAD